MYIYIYLYITYICLFVSIYASCMCIYKYIYIYIYVAVYADVCMGDARLIWMRVYWLFLFFIFFSPQSPELNYAHHRPSLAISKPRPSS